MISSNQLSPVAQAWLQYYNPKLLHAGIGRTRSSRTNASFE